MSGTPQAEHQIDAALVRALLAAQHPDLATLPLQEVDSGWDNAMFRLGDTLAVRLPRRAAAAELIHNEQRWLPQIAPHLPLAVPVPVRVGVPEAGYPWHWSVVHWQAGEPADLAPPAPDQADRFGQILRALHRPAPPDAPRNPVRGVPLTARAVVVEVRLARLRERTTLITPTLLAHWEAALNAPIDLLTSWLHGDLHPRNVLVERGIISALIDWGDITAGDGATDLAAIWMLFDAPAAREAALAAYGSVSAATRARTIGWAILFGAMLLDSGLDDHPRHAAIGERTLRRVTAS